MSISKNSQNMNLAPNDYIWKYLPNPDNPKLDKLTYLAYKIHPIKPTGNITEDLEKFDNYRIDRKLESKKLDIKGNLKDKIERYSWFEYEEVRKQGKLALDEKFIFDFYERFSNEYCYYGLDTLVEDIIENGAKFETNVTQNLIDIFFVMDFDGEVNNGGFSQFFYNGNMFKYLVVEEAIQRIKPKPYLEIYMRLMTEIRNWSERNWEKFYGDGIFGDESSIPLANKINKIGGINKIGENDYYNIEPKLGKLIIDYMNIHRKKLEKFMSGE